MYPNNNNTDFYNSEFRKRVCSNIPVPYNNMLSVNNYFQQIPPSAYTCMPDHSWTGNYGAFQSNYVSFWFRWQMEQERQRQQNELELKYRMEQIRRNAVAEEERKAQIRQCFKAAVDTGANATKKECPELSMVFDGLGVLSADSLAEALTKTISLVNKGVNL